MTKEQNDNTRVFRPIIIEKIPYKLKPNEFYFIDKKTGKKTLVKRKQETISEDKRSKYQRQQDWHKTKQIQKQQEQDKNYEKGIETINSLTKLTLPSTYIGPLFNNNGKSYTDNLISGEGTGNAVGNLAVDLATPLAISKVSKIVQTVPKTVGQKYVAPYISSKMLNRSINANPKGQILVSENYFNSPNNWYRITNTPEVHGIKEMGKNVTTRDSGALIDVPSDNWRTSVLDQPLIRDKEGFLMLDPNRPNGIFDSNKIDWSPRLFQKSGSAHGNTSQASKGQVWSGGISNSSMFPTVILEGQAARQVPMGITRTNFKLTPWKDIPMGQRIGFHTGEMPLDNLGYFQKLGNGKYSYQGQIIPDKRIDITPKINISFPEEVNVQYTKKYPKYLDESGESIVYDDGSYVIKEKSLYDDNSTLKKLHYNVSRDLSMNKIPGIQPIEYLGYKRNYNPQEVVDGLTGYRMTKLNKSYDPVYRQKKITTLDNTYFYPNNNKPSPYQLLDINNIKHDLDFGYVNGVKFSDFGLKNWGIDSFGRYRLFDPMIKEF